MTIDYSRSGEIDKVTISRFFEALPNYLYRNSLAYVAWASWAGFPIVEAAIRNSGLRTLRCVDHQDVYPHCFWRTYVIAL
jgi:hypothetical protein